MSGQTVVVERGGPNVLIRALWFIFIGWWLTGLIIAIAWAALVVIVGIPLFAYLVNRIPQVLTLARRPSTWEITTVGDVTTVTERHTPQRPWWIRAIYLVLVGWWASALWMGAAWLLCVVIIGLPIGIWMFNRTPAVATLHRW